MMYLFYVSNIYYLVCVSYYMSVVTVSMPSELLAEVNQLVEDHNYSGRSEVVRNASRKLIAEFNNRTLEGRPLASVVTVLYPYNSSAIERKLHDLRHDHAALISSNSHSCIGGDQGCLETFVVECDLDELSTFVHDIEAAGESIEVDYSIYPVEDIGESPLLSGQ